MRNFSIIVIMIIVLHSCKKEESYNGPEFVHGNDTLVPCACCDYSDVYVGTYEGHITETEYAGYWMGSPQFVTVLDTTIIFDIDKIWQDQNCIEDSLICKFSIPNFFSQPISITENSGYFSPQIYDQQKFTSDSTLSLRNYTYLSQYDFSYISYQVIATKQ